MVDDVLYNATRGISDLITVHGLINLDFADVKTTMQNGGTALMGSATAAGEGRSERAAIEAISSPLLDGLSIAGATNVLVNITAGRSLGIREATTATSIIQREAGDEVEVIFGTVIDESMGDDLRVTVIATGFDKPKAAGLRDERRPSVIEPHAPNIRYKGEDNIKKLDPPAYERRSQSITLTVSNEQEPDSVQSPANGTAKIRRLHLDDLKERPERIRKDNADVPAFLRKMMD
jgi:cell division protein FtsZ